MGSLNKITLIGRLGRDPELKYTQGGKAFCVFSIATDGSGQKQKRTEWHDVAVFTKSAEACAKYLAKGRQCYVEGKLQSREWEKDGVKRKAWTVQAINVVFLDSKDRANGGDVHGAAASGYEATDAAFPGDDSDIPF
jgi:single-strand DNA-binding protein